MGLHYPFLKGYCLIIPFDDVNFTRSLSARQIHLPDTPETEAYLDLPELLKLYINGSDRDIKLLIAVMVDWLRPDTDYTVVEIVGPAGSGKSTIQEMIRSLIYPNKILPRTAPGNIKDLR